LDCRRRMLCSFRFNGGVEKLDACIAKFSAGGDAASVFNSYNAAQRGRGVFAVNRVAP
jgi:hypothetical protein